MSKTKIGVLVSGGGTNLQALIDAQEQDMIQGVIVVVISNKSEAFALERAKKHNIKTVYMDSKRYLDKVEYTKALTDELKKHEVELVCLAGFMCILEPYFVQKYQNRAINIHPALLPSFGGKGLYGHHVHEAVIDSGAKFSGCSVHFVDEGCDTGPIILQKVVPVTDDDNPDTLAARVLEEEHKAYPEAVGLFCEGRLEIKGRRVLIKNNKNNEE
ncbi:MAG: phosphoribosylglycinamide formyltransferase [bacterium]